MAVNTAGRLHEGDSLSTAIVGILVLVLCIVQNEARSFEYPP